MNVEVEATSVSVGSNRLGNYLKCQRCGIVRMCHNPIDAVELIDIIEDFKQEHENCDCSRCEVA